MKVRPILLLLLFVGSVGVLGWMYYAVTRPALQQYSQRDATILADLGRCGHHKHAKSVQYEQFAHIADEEHHHATATLFRALAHSERVQEQHCAVVIGRLGGSYTPPQRIIIFRGSTAGNIDRSLGLEATGIDTLLRKQIAHYLKTGNRLVARALIWSAAADLRHYQLLAAYRRWEDDPPAHFSVCPRCGNTYSATAQDDFCPHCLTPETQFVRFE